MPVTSCVGKQSDMYGVADTIQSNVRSRGSTHSCQTTFFMSPASDMHTLSYYSNTNQGAQTFPTPQVFVLM